MLKTPNPKSLVNLQPSSLISFAHFTKCYLHSFIFYFISLFLSFSPHSYNHYICFFSSRPIWKWQALKMVIAASCGSSGIEVLVTTPSMKCSESANAYKGTQGDRASENWAYLKTVGIQERKLPSIISKCPKVLTLGLNEKLIPMVECLATLGSKPREVASAITKFPHILSHSVEEKLCPLLAFFQALGVPEKQLGKILLLNPRLISYSIDSKLTQIVDFLSALGLTKDGMIGKVLVKHPFIMGYSVDKRLRPTSEFLKSVGLTELDLQTVVMNFPEVLCRDVNKILKPNFAYLRRCGFNDRQIAALVTGYPPILIKSIRNSLEPRIKFLVEVMGRQIDEVVDYPNFFQHGLKKTLESRHKLLKQRKLDCSLSVMLGCNQKKFLMKYALLEGSA